MSAWFEGLTGPDAGPAIWVVAGLLLAFLLVLALRLLRRVGPGAFATGGRNRRTRLAVMDSTAVDDRRRLVLVRRDDVEHLILIGGPTDLVVEQDIRMVSGARRQQPVEPEGLTEQAEAMPVPPPRPPAGEIQRPRLVSTPPAPPPPPPAEPAAASRENGARRHVAPAVAPERGARQEPAFESVKPTAPSSQPLAPRVEPSIAVPVPSPEQRSGDDPAPPAAVAANPSPRVPTPEEEALMRDIEASLSGPESVPGRQPANGKADEMSLEEEMNRLLGELSGERRQ